MLLLAAGAWAGPETTHTGATRSARIEVRWRPQSWASAAAERTLAAAERDLDRICKELETKPARPIVLFVYDDVAELSAITGTGGNSGFSSGNVVHLPYANDPTRLHEMIHVVTHAWPRSGEEARSGFHDEGLANAVLEFVDGVHVHAVAAFHLRRDQLPALGEMTGADWYAWLRSHPGFNGYDVAASWFRFLLDRFGVAKTKLYFTGTPVLAAYGADAAALETSWREFLAKYPLKAEVETLLRYRGGEPVGFAPYVAGLAPEIAGKPSDWTTISATQLKLQDLSKWNREEGVIFGMNPAPEWTVCEFATDTYDDCAVRARIRTKAYCALRLQIGADNQAILVGTGTYAFRGEQLTATSTAANMTHLRRDTDFVLVRRGETLEVWIDGVKVITTAAVPGPAKIGIGVAQGNADFTEVRVRKLAPK